jgi:hypothetical protein
VASTSARKPNLAIGSRFFSVVNLISKSTF